MKNPKQANVAVTLERARTHHQRGQLGQAERLYREVLSSVPTHFDALNMLGMLLSQAGQDANAIAPLQKAIQVRPDASSAYMNLGNALLNLRQFEQSLSCYEHARSLSPNNPEAPYKSGVALHMLRRLADALSSFDLALSLKPNYPEALYNRALALHELGRLDEALVAVDAFLVQSPNHPQAVLNRGNVLRDLRRPSDALACYDFVLSKNHDSVDALVGRAGALHELMRHQDALKSYGRAISLRPDHYQALLNRAMLLQTLRQPEEALASYERTLAIQPARADVLNNCGVLSDALDRPEAALSYFERAIALRPDFVEVHNNRGLILRRLGRLDDALQSYRRALELSPAYPDALRNCANVLLELKQYGEGCALLDRLIEAAPHSEYARGLALYSRLLTCDWSNHENAVAEISAAIRRNEKTIAPFEFLAASGDGAAQLHCARTFVADRHPASATPMWTGTRYRHAKIRVAYVSADFCEHAMPNLMAGLFERHDRNRFEILAISFGADDRSAMGQRLRSAFDEFHDVSKMADRNVAAMLRDHEVDIVVDLMGFTRGARTNILAYRPAPIQVNYLGYPGTMGADYIDYIIADDFILGSDGASLYSEKVVRLPDCFQANDDRRMVCDDPPTRVQAGLPDAGFVFCSFNNSYKLNPAVFDVWMRLVNAVPGSVLWLVAESEPVKIKLRREAESRGVDPMRLVFAERCGYQAHLARLQLADLFLDTLPFNGGTTASDALWAGVPLLTCAGEAFASRMAGSLLTAVGLPELVTHCLDDYQALALRLATTPAALAELRSRLAKNRASYPLFDTDRFRRHLESAYLTMWERHQSGESPMSFAVRRMD